MALVELLGDKVQGKNGDVDVASIAENELVGIYFSAHWCPPCRGFTPKLATTYNKLKEDGKKFEIIFVSSDKSPSDFESYYKEMPWLAAHFDNNDLKEKLFAMYGIRGIPTLVLLDPKTAEVKNKDGRAVVEGDPNGAKFPW